MTDLQQAQDFLRSRLNAEQSASRNLKAQLAIFAKKLLDLYQKYNVLPGSVQALQNPMLQMEITILIRQLKDELYDEVELLSVSANPDNKSHIVALINATIVGMTLQSRLDKWTQQLRSQLDKSLSSLSTDGKLPNTIPPSFLSAIISFGAGFGLDRLLRQTVTDAYMDEWKSQHPNAQFFISHVASSNPCGECSALNGVKQPIANYPSYGNYHPNCCCYFTFI